MQLPQIRMQQTYAQIGLTIQRPVQEIEQPQAEMSINQELAILEIKQPAGELTIDTIEARANIDLRGPLRRTSDNAEYGYSKVMEAIEAISQQGDRLMKIEDGGNPIADISFEESGIYENTAIIPDGTLDDGVEINYKAKPVEINVETRGATINSEAHAPIHNYKPGKVEAFVNKWNNLSIDFVGLHVDQSI